MDELDQALRGMQDAADDYALAFRRRAGVRELRELADRSWCAGARYFEAAELTSA